MKKLVRYVQLLAPQHPFAGQTTTWLHIFKVGKSLHFILSLRETAWKASGTTSKHLFIKETSDLEGNPTIAGMS